MRSTILIILTCAVCAVLFSACERKKGGGNTDGKKTIGFSQVENNGPWRIAETESMRSEAAKRGYELVLTDAQGTTSKQISDIEDLLARRVSAVFIAPRDFEGLEATLQKAKEAKIPVFFIDREAAGKVGEDYVTFIGSNFIEEGQRVGEWVIKNTNAKAGVVILEGTAGSSVARDRNQGFMNAIKTSPDIKVLASQPADFTRATAQKVMENLIQANGKNITVVYTHNDEMALGAIAALKAANMNPGKDVKVVSVDGQKSALEAIVAGEMNVTVECNPRFGPIAFDTYEKFLKGKPIPAKIINQDRFFDASNAAQFIGEAY